MRVTRIAMVVLVASGLVLVPVSAPAQSICGIDGEHRIRQDLESGRALADAIEPGVVHQHPLRIVFPPAIGVPIPIVSMAGGPQVWMTVCTVSIDPGSGRDVWTQRCGAPRTQGVQACVQDQGSAFVWCTCTEGSRAYALSFLRVGIPI